MKYMNKIKIWDTAGQERFQSLGTKYYNGADCCVLVYDGSSSSTFDDLQAWKEEFINNAEPTDIETFPFVVIGTKIDINNRNEVSIEKIEEWCTANGNIPHFETSSKEGTNIEQAFHKIAELILERRPNTFLFVLLLFVFI